MLFAEADKSQLCQRPASQALILLMEYTELGAGSLEIILIILGAPGTYPRGFPLFLRNFSHLWQPLQRRQSLEWLLEMLQEIETCTRHEGA